MEIIMPEEISLLCTPLPSVNMAAPSFTCTTKPSLPAATFIADPVLASITLPI
jgi:hypothetical protein